MMALPFIWRKVRKWTPQRTNTIDCILDGSECSSDKGISSVDILKGCRPRSYSCQFPGDTFKFQLQVEDESFASKSPGTSPRHSVSSNGSNSSKECIKRYDQTGTPSSRAGLSKLARLLTHKEKSTVEKNYHLNHDNGLGIEATCFFWNRGSAIRKANSIDSLLDSPSIMCTFDVCPPSETQTSTPSDTPNSSSVLSVPKITKPLPSSPSVPAKLESHKRGNIPTSPSVPSKLAKGAPGTLAVPTVKK